MHGHKLHCFHAENRIHSTLNPLEARKNSAARRRGSVQPPLWRGSTPTAASEMAAGLARLGSPHTARIGAERSGAARLPRATPFSFISFALRVSGDLTRKSAASGAEPQSATRDCVDIRTRHDARTRPAAAAAVGSTGTTLFRRVAALPRQ